MRKKMVVGGIACLFLISMAFFCACEKEIVGSSEEETLQVAGLAKDQINWIKPTAEYAEKLDDLAKRGYTGGWIFPERGGYVGGFKTLGNYAYFPAGAIESRTYFTVEVVKEETEEVNTLFMEFLPSMNFLQPVTVTLSWAFLDITPSDIQNGNFEIYYSQDGETWYPIDHSTLTINYYFRTVSFNTDHFTRWGWGF